jgi:hypothetical protein
MVTQKTLASFRELMKQLYEQGADVRCIGRNTMITKLLQSLT